MPARTKGRKGPGGHQSFAGAQRAGGASTAALRCWGSGMSKMTGAFVGEKLGPMVAAFITIVSSRTFVIPYSPLLAPCSSWT